MASLEPLLDDLLGFMDDDERRLWDSGTEEERTELREYLTALWRRTPNPSEEDLKPPYMHQTDWNSYLFGSPTSRETVFNFHMRRWKKQRRADAAARLAKEEAKQSVNSPTLTAEPFDLSKFDPSRVDLSHLHPAEQNRIRAHLFNTQELSLLLSGKNPWTESGKPEPLPSPESAPTPEPEKPKSSDLADLIKQHEDLSNDANSESTRRTADGFQKLADSLRADAESFRQTLADMAKPPNWPLDYNVPEIDGWQERLAEQAEARRNDEQQATARVIQQAIHKALKQNKRSDEPRVEVWAEIRKNRGWYIPAFLVSGLPIYIATLWGPIVGSKTIPEWLAQHGWPRLSTLGIAWAIGIALIALVIVVRSFVTARQRRELLASERTSVSFKLTRLTLDRYDDDTQIMLARFKYSTGVGHSPKVEIKANLTVFDSDTLRLPEYAGVWHGSKVRSKRFSTGDSGDIVVGLVHSSGMVGYEYLISKVGGVTLDANLVPVPGKEFYVQVVFIARTRTDDDIVLFETTQWFKVEAGVNPRFIGTTQPSQFW